MKISLTTEEIRVILLDAVQSKYSSAFKEGLGYKDRVIIEWDGYIGGADELGNSSFYVKEVISPPEPKKDL